MDQKQMQTFISDEIKELTAECMVAVRATMSAMPEMDNDTIQSLIEQVVNQAAIGGVSITSKAFAKFMGDE